MPSSPSPVATKPALSAMPPEQPRRKPLTDPADLMQLLGRMLASFVMFWLVIIWIVRTSMMPHNDRHFVSSVMITFTTAVLSFFMQRATIKLWRRLRDERQAAEAALVNGEVVPE